MRSRPLVTLAALAVITLIWGSTWSVIRIGLDGVPVLTGIAVRFALASILLLALARHQRVRLGTSRVERRLWVINGLLAFCVSYGLVYWAELWIPSALAAVLWATFPLFVAVLAHWWLPGERMTLQSLGGTLIGLAGVAWIFADDLSQLGGPMVVPAAALMLFSPFVSAVANVAIKRWGQGIHPLSLTAVPMGLCAVLMGGLALVFDRDQVVVWNQRTVGALLYLVVAGSAVTFTIYYWLLARLPATRLSLITYGVPIVAVVIGVVWMGEGVTVGMLGGTALVLLGITLAMRSRTRAGDSGASSIRRVE